MTISRGITFRLTLVFVLFASAVMAGGGTLVYANGRQQMLDSVRAELQIASTEKQSALEDWISHLGKDVVAMSKSPAFVSAVQDMLAAAPGSTQAGAAHERVVGELSVRVGGGQPYLRWLVLDPQEGRVLADSDGQEEGTYREDRPYFVNGKVGPFIQNVYYSVSLQAPAMTVSAPVMTAGGRLVAVLAARIDLKEMNAIIQRRTGDRQTDDAFLVNASSLLVTQPRLVADPAILSQGVQTEAVRRCLAHESGGILADDYREIPAIINYAWLPTQNMCLLVKVNQAEAFAPVEAFGRSVILVGGIALLTVAAIAIAMARSITRPVLRLQAGAVRFGRGELDVRLPETGSDELGTLAHEFNQMAAALSIEQSQLRRRLERMYDLSSDLICVIDLEGRYREVNPAVEQVLSFGQGDLLATPFLELVHPDDREATQAALATLAEGRGVTRFENRHRRKDGSWRWLLWNATADTHERLIYAVGRDVTESKRAERELQALFLRNEAILAAVPDIIMEVDTNKVYTWANRAGIAFFGEEVIGKEAAFYFEGDQETYALVQPLFDGEDEAFYVESWQRHQDGVKRLLGWWCHVLKDAEGNVTGALSSARDITEGKRIEEALRESEEKFRTLFDNAEVGMYRSHLDGSGIVALNQRLADLFGFTKEEMLASPATIRWADPSAREEMVRLVRQDGELHDHEIDIVTKGGEVRTTLASVKLYPGEGYLEGTAVDITERKRAEETLQVTLADLERSNRELEQFAYVASHDLQEPLRMVSSYTQLLATRYADKLDQDAHDFIAFAVDGANRMQRLIQDLLTYSRVATHGRPYEPVDLHQPLGEAVANLQAAIREASALVTSGDLPVVSADRAQLGQVFQNLIANAIKFRKKEEPPRVHVSARRQGNEWIMSVKDNGIGIDPQHIRRLFAIFQRLHGSQEYPGTGIGLALCRRIITRHGGRIWVESTPGQGSEFFFTLTADRPPSPSRGAVS